MNLQLQEMISMVLDFHAKFRVTTKDVPTEPSDKDRKLRARLCLEEVVETISAMGVRLKYTNPMGESTIDLTLAIQEGQIEFDDAHAVNFLELGDGAADVLFALFGTLLTFGVSRSLDDLFVEVLRTNLLKVGRDEHGKACKPDGWRPPDIRGVMRKHYPGHNVKL